MIFRTISEEIQRLQTSPPNLSIVLSVKKFSAVKVIPRKNASILVSVGNTKRYISYPPTAQATVIPPILPSLVLRVTPHEA